jgi:CubicO group peptidase (beta-lactamase class C family)
MRLESFDVEVSEKLYGEVPSWLAPEELKGIGSVVIVVFMGEEILWSKAYGWADLERRKRATTEIISRIGSISHCFAAVALLQLAEKGIIDLDEPVLRFLPEIEDLSEKSGSSTPITFRMLATHTSGLLSEPRSNQAGKGGFEGWEEKVLISIPHARFASPPGTRQRYSSFGYALLCLALSRAAEMSYTDLIEELVIQPLDLQNTSFSIDDPEMQDRLAIGYQKDKRGIISSEQSLAELDGRGYKSASEGLFSTVGDLSRFAASLMNTDLLSKGSLEELFTVQPPSSEYGTGFMIHEREPFGFEKTFNLIEHIAFMPGYRASLIFEPESKLGIAMIHNTNCVNNSLYNPDVDTLLFKLVVGMNRGKEKAASTVGG